MKRPGSHLRGLKTGGGRNPNPASCCTEARTSPKGRARGRPPGPALGCVFLAPGPARALGGSGEVACRGTRAAGPSQGPGVTLASSIPDHRDIGPGPPLCIHTRGQEVFTPFPPLEQRRRRGSCSLASPDAGGSCAAATAGAEPSVPGSRAPLPSPARPRAAARTLGLRSRIRGALDWLLPPAAGLRPRPNAQRAGGLWWAQEG